MDGPKESGTSLLVNVEPSKPVATLIAGASTAKAFNDAVDSDRLTRGMRREHRAFFDLKNSCKNGSIQKGVHNSEIIRRPDLIVTALQKANLLDEYAIHEPMQIGRFKRTGLAVNLSFLYEYQEQILEAIEDHTPYNPHEGFRVLCVAWMLAASNGLVFAESPVIDQLADLLRQLPKSEAHKLLTAN